MEGKKYFRCTICNDFHFGIKPPVVCPTCNVKNAYIISTEQEADIVLFEKQNRRGKNEWRLEEFLGILRDWVDGKDFALNSDEEHLGFTLEGILRCERQQGLKYCPCRVITEDFNNDLELICPCNFKIQKTWEEQGRCWCGLFIDPVRYKQ